MTSNKIFPLMLSQVSEKALISQNNVTTARRWHERYGHLNYWDLRDLSEKGFVEGLPVIKNENLICESCAIDKIHKAPFPQQSTRRATKPLELIHADLWGPSPEKFKIWNVDLLSEFKIWNVFILQKIQTWSWKFSRSKDKNLKNG